ncbi:MAG: type II toxin-antitoxin system VapC family toxin [bacterium]|nr:type II toxin-antitoxin system VapC family toxin [Acidimicrobiia bacterium]MCY4650245.1 type II toxin-antitoxin system VapC family toxin [bacterium]
MIAYFDTSAMIPLLIDEPLSKLAERVWQGASWVASARVSYVEARSGLARACRMERISPAQLREAVEGLETLHRQMHQVEVTADLVERAGQLAEELALRAYDAIQLAAAASLDVDDVVVVTGDRQLAAAAQALGLASISEPGTSR